MSDYELINLPSNLQNVAKTKKETFEYYQRCTKTTATETAMECFCINTAIG